MTPKPVGSNTNIQVYLSIQTNSISYYLAVMVRYRNSALNMRSDFLIHLTDGHSVTLPLYSSDLVNSGGSEVCIALYEINNSQILKLKKSNIKTFVFKPIIGNREVMIASINKDVVKVQLNCLK